jgi:hypothetical protein
MSSTFDSVMSNTLDTKKAFKALVAEIMAVSLADRPTVARYQCLHEMFNSMEQDLLTCRAYLPQPVAEAALAEVAVAEAAVAEAAVAEAAVAEVAVAEAAVAEAAVAEVPVAPPQLVVMALHEPVVERSPAPKYGDASHPDVAKVLKELQDQGAIFKGHPDSPIVNNLRLNGNKLYYNNGAGESSVHKHVKEHLKIKNMQRWIATLVFKIGDDDSPFKNFDKHVKERTGLELIKPSKARRDNAENNEVVSGQ